MIFSKKYKYRSIAKKKTNKFFFFFHFFSFLFQSEFFFLIFQKKSNVFDFDIERKNFLKKGFIFKKTSSTFLRHFFKRYKPFFKGFTNLAFDFHFICFPKKNENLNQAKELIDIFKEKQISEKYQIILFFYKGRFFSKDLVEEKLFKYDKINMRKTRVFFSFLHKNILYLKKIYLYYYIGKFKFK